MTRYVQKNSDTRFDGRPFAEMRSHVSALTIRGRNDVPWDTNVGAWVRRWLHCSGHEMTVSTSESSKSDILWVC